MSWSHALNGTTAEIIDQLHGLGAKIEAQDKQYGSSEALITAHQSEIKAAVIAVEMFAAARPDGFVLSGSLSGHSDGVNSDSVSVSMSSYKPAVIA